MRDRLLAQLPVNQVCEDCARMDTVFLYNYNIFLQQSVFEDMF